LENWEKLRAKYPEFRYQGYSWRPEGDALIVKFDFEIPGLAQFVPKLTIAGVKTNSLDKTILDNLVFNLGLMELFSYWKATCSPVIKITAGQLSGEQKILWEELLIKGMGQFYFENGIDFTRPDFVRIETTEPKTKPILAPAGSGSLIAVSGGKDSTVTLEIFRQNSKERVEAFIVHTLKESLAAVRIAHDAGVPTIEVRREIAPQLLELNKQGYLNGHTPIVGYLSFLATLVAYIFRYKEVVFSNERSSNEGNGNYLGMEINHQIDKSFWFEEKFRDYNHNYLSEIGYYSFLRPLYELQTMKIFASMPKYFADFRSCNAGSKTDSWCGRCPKCIAVFAGLAPFVHRDQLLSIFREDLLTKTELQPIIRAMLGQAGQKPLECIGTLAETRAAFALIDGKKADEILMAWEKQNFVPDVKLAWLKKAYENS
jgi:UDP-N-acetyl-alpha-D-muramoyl-L-alanyl-L-glutamate epimerase